MISPVHYRLSTSDPGLQRTYLAARVTLSVLLALGVATLLARGDEQQVTIVMLSAVVGLQAAIAVFKATGPARLSDAGAAWVVGALAAGLGVACAPYLAPRYIGFVAVMTGAVWARRYSRGFGLGMVAFNSYFFIVFIRATLEQLPWLLAALTIGTASAAVVRMLILPDRPRQRMRALLRALRRHAETLIAGALQSRTARPAEGGRDREDRARDTEEAARGIDEVVLQLHELLAENPELVLSDAVFRRELFAVVALSHLLLLQRTHRDASAILPPLDVDPIERLRLHLGQLEVASSGGKSDPVIAEEIARERAAAPAAEAGGDAPAATATGNPPTTGLTEHDRAAVQVAIAGALSIAIGSMLSPARWYWAALTAFFMFVNAGNRGATVRRAIERTIGTAAGVASGLLLGYLLAGHAGLELVLIFPLLFIGFWMLKSSYAVMTVMLTVLLALMYDMLGMLTFDLLLLRLGETIVGAGLGALVAYFVLPSPTTRAVEKVYDAYFAAVDGAIAALSRAVMGEGDAGNRALSAVRELDKAAGALEATIRPVIESVPGHRARKLRIELVLAFTVRYWMHRLLARTIFHSDPVDTDDLGERLKQSRERLEKMRAGMRMEAPAGADVSSREAEAVQQLDALLVTLFVSRTAA